MLTNLPTALLASINKSFSSEDQARFALDLGIQPVDGCIFQGLVKIGRAANIDHALTLVAQYVASSPRYAALLAADKHETTTRAGERFGPPDLLPGRVPTKR